MHPESAIATPHMDRLAEEGMRFTDAHSPSAVCTPTRYGLLTGRYLWRTWNRGVLGGYGAPLLETDRPTLGTLLKAQGYRTERTVPPPERPRCRRFPEDPKFPGLPILSRVSQICEVYAF